MTPLEVFWRLPKAELHIHLEGSLSRRFWKARDLSLYREIDAFSCRVDRSLQTFLGCMERIHKRLSVPESYGEACADLLETLIADNVHYVEITWGPGGILEFHNQHPSAVYPYIEQAIAERSNQIEAVILVDLIRNQRIALSNEIVSWLETEKPSRVVGVNVGGDEVRFPIHFLVPLLERAREANLGVTIHAGESTTESILLEAITEARPDRVGHATALCTPEGVGVIRGLNIHVEACPTSNVHLGYLKRPGDHPLFHQNGLRGSINTDDRSFFSSSLSQELSNLHSMGAASLETIASYQICAVEDAFQKRPSPFRAAIVNAWSNVEAETELD